MATKTKPSLYHRVREILESARANLARSVNSTQVVANWFIGREIIEEEQKGRKRAEYGAAVLGDLSRRLRKDFGTGFSVQNLRYIRQFYVAYPSLVDGREIRHALRGESSSGNKAHEAELPQTGLTPQETALLDNLQAFLLELGKGFAFVARQQRITLDGDHFYIDLVFYHTILKCYVLID